MIIRDVKYIVISILLYIWHDLKSGYDNMAKPKEVLNVLFWLSVILTFTENWTALKYTVGVYIIVYVWKIIKQGDWRRMMKEKEYSINPPQN